MKRTRKLYSILLLSAIMIALPLFMAPVNATIPVEVERFKDYYYFKIHGHPLPQEGYGEAAVIYKNLSTDDQNILIDSSVGDVTHIVLKGDEFSTTIFADIGTIVTFDLWIGPDDDSRVLKFSSAIIIPPQ